MKISRTKKIEIDYNDNSVLMGRSSYDVGETVIFKLDKKDYVFVNGAMIIPTLENEQYLYSYVQEDCPTHIDYMTSTLNPNPSIILLDYYECTTGTEDDEPYEEYELSTYSSDYLKLKHWTARGKEEVFEEHTVPVQIYRTLFEIIERSGMKNWNSMEGYPLDGKICICKFQKGNILERVSSENMPEKGERVFSKLLAELKRYSKEAE